MSTTSTESIDEHRSHREAGPAARAALAGLAGPRRRPVVRRVVRRQADRRVHAGRPASAGRSPIPATST